MKNKKELIKQLKSLDIVRRQKVRLKHAGSSDTYIDLRKAFGYPEVLRHVADLVWKQKKGRVTAVAAGGYGGIPLAAALAARKNLNLTLVREKPKAHGRGVWIEGYVPTKTDRILLVDDILTTGGSLKQMLGILKKTGAKVGSCVVVVKRGEAELEVPVSSLLQMTDLI